MIYHNHLIIFKLDLFLIRNMILYTHSQLL